MDSAFVCLKKSSVASYCSHLSVSNWSAEAEADMFVELQHLEIDRKTGRIKRRVADPFRFL
ncbi:hypothetical protein T07_53 [Trichinella nelsoni]|uniref:Uncharacterized protein n=1 Tax=Trichinella nelsoni TaxID=6336 RepID=A0A0V0SHU3_9BILA|nr:hypothetical protein T07_53 [Trichinella nelsoni]